MPSNCIVGATRWDGWYSGDAGSVTDGNMLQLSLPAHRARAPLHATLTNNRLRVAGGDPAVLTAINAECIAAQAGGLKYWPFLMYGSAATTYNAPDLDEPRKLMAGLKAYRASPENTRIKWCMMQQGDLMGGIYVPYATVVTQMTAWMLESNYQRVLTNRPVLYIYDIDTGIASRYSGSTANFTVMLDALRAAVIAGGAGDPYVVGMNSTTAACIAVGCDAISNYIGRIPAGVPATFASLTAASLSYWAELAATGLDVVPIVMTGWNTTPRIERPGGGASYRPRIGTLAQVVLPTNVELAAAFQAAVDYVDANPSLCPARLINSYAWNEHSEGGWLNPTIGDPSGTRLAAIAPVIA